MLKKFTVTLVTLIFSVTLAFGSGFSIYEQGARATAMGGAFIAQANDITAVFYNPAGLMNLEGTNIGTGVTIIMPQFSFQGPTISDPNLYTEAEKQIFPPVHFYVARRVGENFSLGFGFYTLFGLGSKWPGDWAGRVLATTSDVKTYALNPVMAFRITDNLTASIGATYMLGQVTLEKSIYTGYETDTYVESKLDASGHGVGVNLGIQFKPVEGVTLGAIYRDDVLLKFDGGDATFKLPALKNEAINQLLAAYFPNTKGSSEIDMPSMVGFGIAVDPFKSLTAEFDYMKLNWSSYDVLKIEFDDPVAGSTESEAIRDYQDSYSLRFGLEYRYNERLSLRAGYLRDNHAVPDERVEPSLPEGDRDLYSFGLGYKMGHFTIDAYYMYLQQKDRTITTSELEVNGQPFPFNGTYKGMSHLFGATFGYSF